MSRRLGYNLIIGLAFVLALVLWIVSIAVDDFGFTLNWGVLIVAGTAGLCFILRGIFGGSENVVKKLRIMFGSVLLALAFLSIVWELGIENDTLSRLVLPVVSLILVIGLIIGMLAVGARRWDHGDNQSAGYKNFHQRKVEKEKLEQEGQKRKADDTRVDSAGEDNKLG